MLFLIHPVTNKHQLHKLLGPGVQGTVVVVMVIFMFIMLFKCHHGYQLQCLNKRSSNWLRMQFDLKYGIPQFAVHDCDVSY